MKNDVTTIWQYKSIIRICIFVFLVLLPSTLGSDTKKGIQSVNMIHIGLLIDSEPSLSIFLSEDGTIHRMGSGTLDTSDRTYCMGFTTEPYFTELKSRINPSWLGYQIQFDIPNKIGELVELSIIFSHDEGSESILLFLYGSESEGPPLDICDFVTCAVELTEPWFKDQKKLADAYNE